MVWWRRRTQTSTQHTAHSREAGTRGESESHGGADEDVRGPLATTAERAKQHTQDLINGDARGQLKKTNSIRTLTHNSARAGARSTTSDFPAFFLLVHPGRRQTHISCFQPSLPRLPQTAHTRPPQTKTPWHNHLFSCCAPPLNFRAAPPPQPPPSSFLLLLLMVVRCCRCPPYSHNPNPNFPLSFPFMRPRARPRPPPRSPPRSA